MKFSLSYDGFSRTVLTVFGGGPKRSEIDVNLIDVSVRMGIWFWSVIPRADITSVERRHQRVISRGVHGWSGRWLVNGSNDGLVTLAIDPPARARMMGIPIRLRELIVSLDDPDGFVAALGTT